MEPGCVAETAVESVRPSEAFVEITAFFSGVLGNFAEAEAGFAAEVILGRWAGTLTPESGAGEPGWFTGIAAAGVLERSGFEGLEKIQMKIATMATAANAAIPTQRIFDRERLDLFGVPERFVVPA